jgi:FlaA1/EpsC-like NDP-sugar epimerase
MKLPLLWAVCVWAIVKITVSRTFGLHLLLWRYFSIPDLKRLAGSNIIGSLLVAFVVGIVCPYSFPRSVIAIDFFLAILFAAGAGAAVRLLAEPNSVRPGIHQARTLIFGAGSAGVLLLRESRDNFSLSSRVCGFVDDDKAKRGRFIQGIPVLGAGSDLENIVRKHGVQEVLIAIPSARGPEMCAIVKS